MDDLPRWIKAQSGIGGISASSLRGDCMPRTGLKFDPDGHDPTPRGNNLWPYVRRSHRAPDRWTGVFLPSRYQKCLHSRMACRRMAGATFAGPHVSTAGDGDFVILARWPARVTRRIQSSCMHARPCICMFVKFLWNVFSQTMTVGLKPVALSEKVNRTTDLAPVASARYRQLRTSISSMNVSIAFAKRFPAL